MMKRKLGEVKKQRASCACGGKPVFFRRNEGHFYCKRCFCDSIEKKFRRTVAKYQLVRPGDVVAVGLSGGKDSSTVLSLMHKLLKPRRDITLIAVSIDEGIEGYRAETLEKAKELCSALGVRHEIRSFKGELGKTLDQKLRKERDSCTFCGVGRRYLLNKAARELEATKLCVGHNLDDECQSVLMNFLRGDLLRAGRMGVLTESPGSGGKFIPRIKPLRFIPEREIMLYALLKKLPFSSKECAYIRGLRPEVRDFLNGMEDKYPGTKFSLLESYDKIAPTIKKAVPYKGSLGECAVCGEPSSQKVCKTCELWGDEASLEGEPLVKKL